jgi:hypothetical protein
MHGAPRGVANGRFYSNEMGFWKMRALPNRLFRLPKNDVYYRGVKCSVIFSFNELPKGVTDLIWKHEELPFEENKDLPWTDHVQPPKGDGWEDIEK